ncbi:hypothetical protein BOX37_23450 [Nocardia mangyaensis]|uniref:Peptide chain release factor 1 n=1 Tax=Nocardia mangyaensis TaxID=2213200 RepID=A0A1J0VWH3_9NOCA|nr:Vms1/Ankzf1 family peptidyl-tRNA hydrolase [Nocardia mangyaensis]APE36396.1 hypothetical protein BOX37_23450 [Nocardia mangyaensis]
MTHDTTFPRPTPVLAIPDAVFAATGTVVSVYLTTESSLPQAADRVALRWKNLRTQLAENGAPPEALAAIDPLIEGSFTAGEALVAFADRTGLLYTAHLPEPPEADSASLGSLPDLAPLLAATQVLLPHLVVVIDRVGADLICVVPDGTDVQSSIEGEALHVTRSAPGGWSQRRFQQRAENRWEANSREVADEITRIVDTTPTRLVIVSGDVRAVQFLREHLPPRVTDLLTEVQGDYSTLDEALHRSTQVVADLAADETAALLSGYRQERHSRGLAVAGAKDTLTALRAGQVDTLILDPTLSTGQTAWFGPERGQVGATPQPLLTAGVSTPQRASLTDVAIRGAAATGAAMRIVPAGTPELGPDGIAALLRYR